MKDDEEREDDDEAEDEDEDDESDDSHSRNISGNSTSSSRSSQALRRHYSNVLYAGARGTGGSGSTFNRQWPDDIHALRATPYNGTASSTVPRIPVLPLVPVSTRPGLPGSIFRWQLDLDNSYIRRVLERQLKEGSPYIGLFLYRRPGDTGVTIKKPTQAQVDAATASAARTSRRKAAREQVKTAVAESEDLSAEKLDEMLRRGREGSIGRAEWLKAINLQGDRIADEVSKARTRLMTLRQERDEVLHTIVATIAGAEGRAREPWRREKELEEMQERAASLHEAYIALQSGMKQLEDKLDNHKREFDKVLEEGRTQQADEAASAAASSNGLDLQELASALSSSAPKSAASTAMAQSLKDYDEVNKVHRFGVLAEFRLNGDSVTIICHRRIEIKGLSPVSPNIIMVNVRHHDEQGPAPAPAPATATATSSSSTPTAATTARSPASPSTSTSTATTTDASAPSRGYSSEVLAYTNLIQEATASLLSHDEIKKRSKSFTTPFIDMSIPGHLCDYVTSLLATDADTLQDVLSTIDLRERCYKVLTLTKNEQRTMAARKRIQEKVSVPPAFQNTWLKEQKRQIERILGGRDNRQAIVDRFTARLEGKAVPPEVQRVLDEELEKLSGSDSEGSEYSITRNYVDWLTSMPYGVYSTEQRDIAEAERILNEDHYGMDDVKQRILEFIASTTRAGKEAQQGKILCLSGPPGVGKTSIAKSIARALGREYSRFSVGGMDDVAEIKGHRRTYLGSMPGKIIAALKHSGKCNPLILIDEIDKVGKGGRGDPSAALLEVLDPEQNATFIDHYLDVPVDLSHVLFICTANDPSLIPGPLADRMDFIPISGYVWKEKQRIITDYIEPSVRRRTGIKESQVRVTAEAVEELVRWYCREAGMRNLQKIVEKMYGKAALTIARSSSGELDRVPLPMYARHELIEIGKDNLKDYAGKPVYTSDSLYEVNPVGVVTGLAWTSKGGSLIHVEAALADQNVARELTAAAERKSGAKGRKGSDGGTAEEELQELTTSRGALLTTGSLGDVMKECRWPSPTPVAKRQMAELRPHSKFFQTARLHLHLPAGSTPKDGPSAGITYVTAFLSLALNRPTVRQLAMTGELSLTGRVLPIGGIKEKFLACKRSAVTSVIVPEENRKDVEELADFIREGLEVRYATTIDEVVEWSFGGRAALREDVKAGG